MLDKRFKSSMTYRLFQLVLFLALNSSIQSQPLKIERDQRTISDLCSDKPQVSRAFCETSMRALDEATYLSLTKSYCDLRKQSENLAWLQELQRTCRFPDNVPTLRMARKILRIRIDDELTALVMDAGLEKEAKLQQKIFIRRLLDNSELHEVTSREIIVTGELNALQSASEMITGQMNFFKRYASLMARAEGCLLPNPPQFPAYCQRFDF